MLRSVGSPAELGLKYERFLPTKYVSSPNSLLRAVTERVGEGNFYIEVCTEYSYSFLDTLKERNLKAADTT